MLLHGAGKTRKDWQRVAIILFPVFFLCQLGLRYLLAYLGIVVVYALCFLLFNWKEFTFQP